MGIITDEVIRNDIAKFEQRIQVARDKLAVLPPTAGTWQARKKLKEKRRILQGEIKHVQGLIRIAEESLST